MIQALWHYKSFIVGLVVRDFRTKYLNSALGSTWAVVFPLTQILIYTLIFSQVMQARLPGVDDTLGYSIYLCAGLIHWLFFAEVLNRTQNVFLEQANLLKKAKFPRSSLPLYVILSSSINYIILLVIFILFLIIVGRSPDVSVLGIIPLVIIQLGFATGAGVLLGTLNVFFRDVGHGMGVILQFWFWLTPIVYPAQIVPESMEWFMNMNPMYGIIQGYQNIFLFGAWPTLGNMMYMAVLSIIFLLLGFAAFVKLDKEMVDEL